MSLQIQAFTDSSAFEILQEEWNELLAHSSHRCLFLTWEWQSNWWAAYHAAGDLWVIAVRDENQQLLALAPWFIDQQATGRWVRSVGCVDVTDYLEMILRVGYEEAALEALTAYVVSESARYDGLSFCNIPQASPLIPHWQPILEKHGFQVEVIQQEVCPIIPLPETWEGYFELLTAKNAGELRRKMRNASGYEVTWAFVQPEDDIQAALDRFLKLMRASSLEKATFLDNPVNLDFFQRIMPVIHARGWLKLSFIQVNGKDAASYLSFDYDNQILLYNSGQDHQVAPKLSPGILLLMNIIRAAIESKRTHFDFLRGDEEYKYRMGGQDTSVMMLNATLG